jgi:hypothetical protein
VLRRVKEAIEGTHPDKSQPAKRKVCYHLPSTRGNGQDRVLAKCELTRPTARVADRHRQSRRFRPLTQSFWAAYAPAEEAADELVRVERHEFEALAPFFALFC